MPDISMCPSTTCPMRGNCYRAQAKPSIRQSFFSAEPLENGTCEYYWPIIPPIAAEPVNKVYLDNGHNDRKSYLKYLSEEYGVPLSLVLSLSTILGKSEDFDGLVSALEDAALTMEYEGE